MNSLVLLENLGLSKSAKLNYSAEVNAFLSQGYTSLAGNTYLNTLRLMEGIVIKEDVGHGYCHTFINGIRLYDLSKNLLCDKSYHCRIYNKSFIASEIKDMLKTLLFESCKKENVNIDVEYANEHIDRIVSTAMVKDQRVIFEEHAKLYLTT